MKLIDADKFLSQIEDQYMEHDITKEKYLDLEDRIMQQPIIEERKTGKWIPCSERLPEDVQIGEEYPLVIFCTKDATYTGFYEYYLGGRWWSDSDYVVDGVIAWMPLPEPYGGEQE